MSFQSSHTIQKGKAQKGDPADCVKAKVSALLNTLWKDSKRHVTHWQTNTSKRTADKGFVSKENTNKAPKPRETAKGTAGQERYMESKANDAQHRGPEKPRLALCQGPRQRTQEMMSRPATEPNRTRNLGIQASTAEKSPQPDCSLPRCSAVCPCPQAEASADLKGRVCGNAEDAGSGTNPPAAPTPGERHLAFCPKEQKGNTGGPGRARPPLPSHPANTESFLCESGDGFSRGMSASSKPRHMWVTSLWAGCVHTPGESGHGGMGRVQPAPAAQADLTPSRSLHPPRGGTGVSQQPCISAHSGSRSSTVQKQQPHWPGAACQQG